MPRFLFLASLLLLLVQTSTSFTASRPAFARTTVALAAGMAQPETTTKTKVTTKEKTKQKEKIVQKKRTGDPQSRRKEEFEDAPMYILYLLEDDSYDAEHVVTRMCAIIEDLDEDQAATVFQQAMSEGKAMCGKFPYERAEMFKEQLLRSDPMIFCDLQEENS